MCVTFPFLIFNLNISRMKILFLGKIKVSKGLQSLNKSEEIGIGNYCNHKKIIKVAFFRECDISNRTF